MNHDIILNEGDLTLAPLEPEHIGATYVSWLNDPKVIAGTEIPATLHTEESVREYVKTTLKASDAMIWRILVDETHVGNIRLSSITEAHKRASVALIIGCRERWGKGIASRSIALLTAYALNEMDLHKVYAGMYASNPASRQAFEKAGFHLEAEMEGHVFENGQPINVWQMVRMAS